MTTNLLKQAEAQAASISAADLTDAEGAKLGAAAERKRQEEAGDSLAAALESHGLGGKAVKWQRRIRANGEVRHVTMYERDGAYSERGFLAICNKAARAAGKGRLKWDGEAVDAIAAELCVSILSDTGGRMPRRGSLGRLQGFEDADAAYLTTCAARLIADALAGEPRAAGLSAEIAPMAATEGAAVVMGGDLLAESLTVAEGAPDRYLAEPPNPAELPDSARYWTEAHWTWAEGRAGEAAQPLALDARQSLSAVAAGIGERPAAVQAALASALRPGTQAAELVEAGLSTSPGALRKAASVGRGILADHWPHIYRCPDPDDEGDQGHPAYVPLMALCQFETAQREARHISEKVQPPTRKVSLEWPDRKPPRSDFYVNENGERVSVISPQG